MKALDLVRNTFSSNFGCNKLGESEKKFFHAVFLQIFYLSGERFNSYGFHESSFGRIGDHWVPLLKIDCPEGINILLKINFDLEWFVYAWMSTI